MPETILVVDDEKEIADLIELFLTNENFFVHKCSSGNDALSYLKTEKPDLAILDLMLPDIDGLTLCQTIRQTDSYPIIMLTAKTGEMDQITGLTMGADDYITKPFKPLTLLARVKAQLRRYKKYNGTPEPEPPKDNAIRYLDLVLEPATHDCLFHGEKLPLTPTEFQILQILLEEQGKVVSSEDLFQRIWENEYYVKNNNTIAVHIRHLREKMHDSAENPKYIKTVWGLGYKIENEK